MPESNSDNHLSDLIKVKRNNVAPLNNNKNKINNLIITKKDKDEKNDKDDLSSDRKNLKKRWRLPYTNVGDLFLSRFKRKSKNRS